MLRARLLVVSAFVAALALVGDREALSGGWSAAASPGDRSAWDGFVVRRSHTS